MLLRLCFLGIFLFLFVSCFEKTKNNRVFGENEWFAKQTVGKFTKNTHLNEYLEALRRIIDFCNDHPNEIDINLYFGLFLANVNLKHIYIDKHQVIPEKLRGYLTEIIGKLEKFSDFFSYMVKGNNDPRNNKYKAMFSLFANASVWVNRLPNLVLSPLDKKVSYFDRKNLYIKRHVQNFDENAWVPNPEQSDLCLVTLASVKVTHKGPGKRRCKILKLCHEILLNGTDSGYALAHRLLLLQQARFGRGCSIFSESKDNQMSRHFCSIAYQEVENIASHDFQIIDLLLEHVCLCALDGNAQFLRRSWLETILRFQTTRGCFTEDIRKMHDTPILWSRRNVWKMAKNREHDIMGGYCNGHTTALATGTLAMACRFILQYF